MRKVILDVDGSVFSPMFAREMIQHLNRQFVEADEVEINPLQMASIENQSCNIVDVKVIRGISTALKMEFPPVTLCGIPTKRDYNCKASSIYFKKSGEVIGEIRNLAT